MIDYIKKLFIFALPLFFLFFVSFAAFFFSNEFVSVEKIIEIQKESDILVGKAYIQSDGFKQALFFADQPDIITFGNSRVLQFRSEFFKNTTTFYNTGGLGKNSGISAMTDFLNNIPEEDKPKMIIVGLEQSFLNVERYAREYRRKETVDSFDEELQSLAKMFLINWREVYLDYIKGKYSIKTLLVNIKEPVYYAGFNAIANKNGYRNDGSYYYGEIINKRFLGHGIDFEDTFRRIKKGINLFSPGKEPSSEAKNDLEVFLQTARERDVYIVAFFPPYAPTVYKKMMSFGKDYGYIGELVPILKEMFKKYGYSFFDFSDAEFFGSSDSEFIDGFHGSEKVYLRLFISMIKNDSHLAKYADIIQLKKNLLNSKSDLEVF